MKNNKLYGAAMLADEINDIAQKCNLAKKISDEIIKNKMSSGCISQTSLNILTEAYKEMSWKSDIINDYLSHICLTVKKLDGYINSYYDGGEQFLFDVAMLCQEASQNIEGVGSKKLLSVLGKEQSKAEGTE